MPENGKEGDSIAGFIKWPGVTNGCHSITGALFYNGRACVQHGPVTANLTGGGGDAALEPQQSISLNHK